MTARELSLLSRKFLALAVCLSLCWSASAAEFAEVSAAQGAPIAAAPNFHEELSLRIDSLSTAQGPATPSLPELSSMATLPAAPASEGEAARAQAAAFTARVLALPEAAAQSELAQAQVPAAQAQQLLEVRAAAQARAAVDPAYASALKAAAQPRVAAAPSSSSSLIQRAKSLALALRSRVWGAELQPAPLSINGGDPSQAGGTAPQGVMVPGRTVPVASGSAPSAATWVPTAKKVSELLRAQKNDPEAAFALASSILSDPAEPRVEVRASALRILQSFPAERALPIYIRLTGTPSNWYIQRMAAKLIGDNAAALGEQREAAEKALRDAYKSSNPSVRLMAKASLEKMGVDPGPERAPQLSGTIRIVVVPSPARRITPQQPTPPKRHHPFLWLTVGVLAAFLIFHHPAPSANSAPVQPPAVTQTIQAAPSLSAAPSASITAKDGTNTLPTVTVTAPVDKTQAALESIAKSVDAQTKILQQQEADRQAEKAKASSGIMGTILLQLAMAFLPIILMVWLFARMQKGAMKGAMQQTNQTNINLEKPDVKFSDVAGIDDALLEVHQIIDYLKHPEIYEKLGAKPPKGVLLEGPPGTGKTLLARALAGEAHANFISMRGSDFIQMFVGVGASRVRELFDTARKSAPTIVFIDEIDAIGGSREHAGPGGGSESEHRQTLVALLGELDGFSKMDNVIVIAATNRAQDLDPALMRPGRFDRKIYVGNPDVLGREAILAVHGSKVRLGPDADLEFAARRTPGLSGAAMANIINESALQGARNERDAINSEDVQRAVDKETFGDRRHLFIDDATKERVAWHESGHALAGMLAGEANGKAPNKITIIPHGSAALGYAEPAQQGETDTYLQTQDQLQAQLVGIMGGRAAEEIVYGKVNPEKGVSTGPGSDIEQADRIARVMVEKLGMNQDVGILVSGSDPRNPFGGPKTSEQTRREADVAVRALIGKALDQAKELFRKPENFAKLQAMVTSLKEHETIYGPEIEEIVHGKKS